MDEDDISEIMDELLDAAPTEETKITFLQNGDSELYIEANRAALLRLAYECLEASLSELPDEGAAESVMPELQYPSLAELDKGGTLTLIGIVRREEWKVIDQEKELRSIIRMNWGCLAAVVAFAFLSLSGFVYWCWRLWSWLFP